MPVSVLLLCFTEATNTIPQTTEEFAELGKTLADQVSKFSVSQLAPSFVFIGVRMHLCMHVCVCVCVCVCAV